MYHWLYVKVAYAKHTRKTQAMSLLDGDAKGVVSLPTGLAGGGRIASCSHAFICLFVFLLETVRHKHNLLWSAAIGATLQPHFFLRKAS